MLRLAFDFIIAWREIRARPNAYFSYFMRKHSHILRENSPTIYGNNGTTLETKR